jgi:hypothetical protein
MFTQVLPKKILCIPLEIEGVNYADGARNKLGF